MLFGCGYGVYEKGTHNDIVTAAYIFARTFCCLHVIFFHCIILKGIISLHKDIKRKNAFIFTDFLVVLSSSLHNFAKQCIRTKRVPCTAHLVFCLMLAINVYSSLLKLISASTVLAESRRPFAGGAMHFSWKF